VLFVCLHAKIPKRHFAPFLWSIRRYRHIRSLCLSSRQNPQNDVLPLSFGKHDILPRSFDQLEDTDTFVLFVYLLAACSFVVLFYRAPLQKRPIIWRSLLIVATPYVFWFPVHSCFSFHTYWSLLWVPFRYIFLFPYIWVSFMGLFSCIWVSFHTYRSLVII